MDLPIMILLALVCMAIGFVLALLIGVLRGERTPVEQRDGAPGAAATSTGEALDGERAAGGESKVFDVQPPSSVGAVVNAPAEPGWMSVLHVRRDTHSGALIVETGGKIARSADELDREAHEGVIAAYQQLGHWLGLPDQAGAPAPGTIPANLQGGSLDTAPGEATPGTPPRPARLSFHPIDVVSNALRAELRRPAGWAARSLAEQVDEVLQEKLQGTPHAKRGIRLLDGPDQGVWVQVGMEKYHGVEEVPDAEIRALIGEAADEWRKRTELGKTGTDRPV